MEIPEYFTALKQIFPYVNNKLEIWHWRERPNMLSNHLSNKY